MEIKEKKVGIISLYYGSRNYGGLLQAYALTNVINEMGYDAEQINYKKNIKLLRFKRFVKKSLDRLCGKNNTNKIVVDKKIRQGLEIRNYKLDKFRDEMISHSKVVTLSNLKKCYKKYDVFVCGSDQIWNHYYDDVYFMNFVPRDKIKIAYAASMSNAVLDNKLLSWIKRSLSTMNSVSVREKDIIPRLSDENISIDWVLDPTMLFSKDKWLKFGKNEVVKEKYIFCYFLGGNIELRKLVREYADKKGLKVCALSFLQETNYRCDLNFADIQLFDVGPQEFVTLINEAEYVFTDSFHATVFSIIMQTQFFVFDRANNSEMNIRIDSLLSIFDLQERFITEKSMFDADYLLSNDDIVFKEYYSKYEEMKRFSLNYLEEAISECTNR